jgi:hypothetical protein
VTAEHVAGVLGIEQVSVIGVGLDVAADEVAEVGERQALGAHVVQRPQNQGGAHAQATELEFDHGVGED